MEERLTQIVIDWMAGKGPAEWHGVATNWNWDSGARPLFWILDQPACDKVTALQLFWNCDGYYQLDATHPQFVPGRDDNRIVEQILRNWSRYRHAKFRFPLPYRARYVRSEGYGLSEGALQMLKPFLVDLPGKERYPDYGGGIPAECQITHFQEQGEAVSEFYLQLLADEQTGKNMSQLAPEIAARHDEELEQFVSEWDEVLDEVEKYKGT